MKKIISNELPPEVLEKSLQNREYQIDWSSLKPFKYEGINDPLGLIGKSISGNLELRVFIIDDASKPQIPIAVFYKQKKNKMRIEEVYYLSDEESNKFQEIFIPALQRKH